MLLVTILSDDIRIWYVSTKLVKYLLHNSSQEIMKLFAGTLFYTNTLPDTFPDFDMDILKISERWIFVMWWLEESQSLYDIQSLLWNHFWEIQTQDISCEDDGDEIEILLEEFEQWVFESVSFEGPEVNFETILERFAESDTVICVREAEASHRYGNKVIRVDFLY